MVSEEVQLLVEQALRARSAGTARAHRDAPPPEDAQKAIAALVDALSACSSSLNAAFQRAVDAGDHAAASLLKDGMDTIAFVIVGLERRVIALYEQSSADAATALGPVLANLKQAAGDTSGAATTAGHISQAVSALTAVLGLVAG